MKPFKESKFGKFLQSAAPKIMDTIGDVLPDKGVLGIVRNLISKDPEITPEQKAEMFTKMSEFETEIFQLELQDRQSARNMQIEGLHQDDTFSKRFVYYLSGFVVLSATAFGIMLFFVEFPERNQRLVEMFADVYLFAGAMMVLNFFLGSSLGSKIKTKILGNDQTA